MLAESLDSSTLSLNGLAREAGMAKSNVYRYFESREAVLMEVLAAEWIDWHTDLVASLDAADSPQSDEALAATLARSMGERPSLCHLVSVLPTVLERNTDVERVAAFKRAGLRLTAELAQAFHRAAPGHPVEHFVEMLRTTTAFVVGSWPLANPAPHVGALLASEPFRDYERDFERDLARVCRLLLRGLASE